MDGGTKSWAAFVSGASVISPSGTSSGLPIGGTAGIMYKMNGSSSLIMELRKNSFIISKSSAVTNYSYKSFSIDGHSYEDVIGSTTTPVVNSINSIFSLDIGYRYELMPESVLSPFAEVLGGGSISGILSSEGVGVRYAFNAPFLFDFAARGDQMFAHGMLPQKALGFEAGVCFEW